MKPPRKYEIKINISADSLALVLVSLKEIVSKFRDDIKNQGLPNNQFNYSPDRSYGFYIEMTPSMSADNYQNVLRQYIEVLKEELN